ncbi:MAG TPA: hypothetical protein PKA63_11535, partial [Oligoflexia bacterium]|nr:hypothetical protein [Oligoflexia bacterium]HMP49286.1 hypothetical protein [Oligoflexia bacterium]
SLRHSLTTPSCILELLLRIGEVLFLFGGASNKISKTAYRSLPPALSAENPNPDPHQFLLPIFDLYIFTFSAL